MKKQFLSLFVFLGLMITLGASKVQSQIVRSLYVDIPFEFYAGDAKFPPGKYIIKPLDNTELTVMEISTSDGRNTALFEVRDSLAGTSPAKTELIFDKYGNHYFLSKLFDEGNKRGSALGESRYEKKLSSGATREELHVPASRGTE